MHTILDRLAALFSPERLGHYLADDLAPNLTAATAVFLAFYLVWKLVDRALRVALPRRLDETARAFLRAILRYMLLTIGVVTALAQLGLDISSLITSLGVAGLTIGFAAKDVVSNLISGLFIFWDRPFVVGDLVEIGGQYGRVAQITMRSTRVVTNDGRMLAIPNSEAANKIVTSYTNFPNLRLDVGVTVGTAENLGRVRALALALIEGDERFMTEPAPVVVVTDLNDYNVAMQLQVWLTDERTHVPVRFELRERLSEALRGANVVLPYETLQIRTQVA